MTQFKASKTSAWVALFLIVPAPTLAVLLGQERIALPGYWGQVLFLLVGKVWFFGLPAAWHLLVDRQPVSWSPARRGGWVFGAVSGLAIAAVIFGAYFLVAKSWIDPEDVKAAAKKSSFDQLAVYIGLAVYWITLNSALEEYCWRWFVFSRFQRVLPGGAWVAAVASAVCFTLHHTVAMWPQLGALATMIASVGVCIGGLIWSWCYKRYASLWPAYLSHAIVDVPIFVIGGLLVFG